MNDSQRKIRNLLILEDWDGFRLVPLEESSYFLGRDLTNSIVVRSQGISRQHALFLRVTNADPNSYGFMLIDGNLQGEASTHGTFINGVKCASTKLNHGDRIVFGRQMKAKYLVLGALTDLEFIDFCKNFDFEEAVTQDINPQETFVHEGDEPPSFAATSLIRLASFPEILPSPMFEVNLKGDLTYINPAAYNAFPRLQVLGVDHPTVQGLISLTQSSKQKILSREVTVDQQVYEQSIHFIFENGLIRCVLTDITDRKKVEAELFKRDRLLQSVAEATTHLLANASHEEAIDAALARFGTTAGVDRICISENHVHAETHRLATSIRYEWTGPQIASIRHLEHRQNQLYSNPHLQRWYTTLAGCAAISGVTENFPTAEQTMLSQENVQSVLAVPIIVKNNFWGFVELHDCNDHYHWSDQEEAILRTMAASVSAALERQDKDEVIYSHLQRLQKVTEYANANLIGKDFSKADLKGKDFSNANLSGANLYQANLSLAVAITTNFTGTNLTGACIQDWNINTKTIFDNVHCDYIFLKENKQERRPLSGNFGPGEFVALIQKSLDTIDLIFVDGIDWQAFFQSFQQLRSQFSNQEINIQAIEKKREAFVVRLETPLDLKKSAIETKAKELYGEQLKVLEEQYIEKMKLQGTTLKIVQDSLAFERQRNTQILSMVENMANKDKVTQNFNAQVGNVVGVNEGIQYTSQHNYAPELKQNLAESAKEIQDLLSQLQENNTTDLQTVVEQRIKTDPTFRQRLQNALKEGGVETLKVLFAPIGIPIEIVKGWIDAEGS